MALPLAAAALAAIQAAAALPAGPSLSIVGPGASAADPTFGASATIVAQSGGAALPWVRLDRPDGVAETGTGPDGDGSGRGWMTVADESVTYAGALVFPVWMRPDWGPFQLLFGGAANNKSVDIVASGWSTNGPNATQLTENSSVLTIHYSTVCRQAKTVMDVTSLGPGKARLSVSNDQTDPLAKSCPITQLCIFAYAPSAKQPGSFDYLYQEKVETTGFSTVLQWAHPGIYYYGAAPSSRGRMMALTAGGEYNTVLGTHPTALVVATADGQVFNATGGSAGASLPTGFQGQVVHVTPLPKGQNYSAGNQHGDGFCLTLTNLTIFAGVAVNMPFCTPDIHAPDGIQRHAKFVSIVLPPWLHVFPTNNRTTPAVYVPHVNRTITLPDGNIMTTFGGVKGRWWIYNTHITMSFTFSLEHAGKVADAKLLLHDELSDTQEGASPMWAAAKMACVPTPEVPLPKKLITSVTYAVPEMLFDGDSPDGHFTFLGTYKTLGFNTVMRGPQEGWDYHGNRTGPEWAGLKYGPVGPGFTHSGYTRPPLYGKVPPNATMVRQLLTAAGKSTSASAVADEMRKWGAAQRFANIPLHGIDWAYDGIFFATDVEAFCEGLRQSQADFSFIDVEGMGGYDRWRLTVADSENAQHRRWPGETLENLAWRMANELLAQWSACLKVKSDFPVEPQIQFYGGLAPDAIMSAHDFTASPSTYGPFHHLAMYPDWLRVQKQQMVNSGKARVFIPTLTAATYGEMDATAVLDGTLHTYGVGATGFSFFSSADFDDGGKILALSTATALAVPFEDHFFLGRPLGVLDLDKSAPSENVLAWSGMSYQNSLWVVITPQNRGKKSTLKFKKGNGVAETACDLVKGKVLTLHDLMFSAVLDASIVLHISADAATGPGCGAPLAKNLWWPQQ